MQTLEFFSKEILNRFEEYLTQKLENSVMDYRLKESMKYSLLNGGKRVRPLLVFLVLDMFNENLELGYDIATAIEYIHTYSLIHDDLPSMDNDDFRRGKPTNHKVYGEAMAILAGDSLNTDAFKVVLESDYSNDVKVRLLTKLAECAGSFGMVSGQVIDIFSNEKRFTLEELKELHYLKTGKMFEISILSPLYILDRLDLEKDFLQIAYNIGLIFQIQDDILDVTGNIEDLGKSTGKDELLNKSTYVSILGLDSAKKHLDDIYNQTITLIENLKLNDKLLIEFLEYLTKRNK